MADQDDVFDGDRAPRRFHEKGAANEAFGLSAFSDETALEGAADDDFREFWEIVECMGQEGWESAIAAWEAAETRRSETKAERERSVGVNTQSSAVASGGNSGKSAFAGGISDVIQLKKVENLSPDGKPAIPILLELLQDRDERVRFLAASVLGGIGPDAGSAVPALTDLLNDESRAVRRVAAKALKKIEAEKK
jgi:hypothetical protein